MLTKAMEQLKTKNPHMIASIEDKGYKKHPDYWVTLEKGYCLLPYSETGHEHSPITSGPSHQFVVKNAALVKETFKLVKECVGGCCYGEESLYPLDVLLNNCDCESCDDLRRRMPSEATLGMIAQYMANPSMGVI